MDRRLIVSDLIAAQRRQTDYWGGDDKAIVDVVVIGRRTFAQCLPELGSCQGHQPGAIHRAVGHLADIGGLTIFGIQRTKAGRGDVVRLAVVVQLAVLIPLDRTIRLPLGKGGVNALVFGRIQTAFAAVQTLRKAALIELFAVFVVFGAFALIQTSRKGAFVMHFAVGIIFGALAFLLSGGKGAFIKQRAILIQLAVAFVQPGGKIAFIQQDACFVRRTIAFPQAVYKVAFVNEQAFFIVFLAFALQKPFFQFAFIQRNGLGLIRIDDDAPGPGFDARVFHIEMSGKEMAQQERPDHKIQQQRQHDRADSQGK